MENYMEILGKRAKEAAREAARLGTEEKNRGLVTVAEELVAQTESVSISTKVPGLATV